MSAQHADESAAALAELAALLQAVEDDVDDPVRNYTEEPIPPLETRLVSR